MSDIWQERHRMRKLGVFMLALTCLWLTISCYAIHMALPFNPIRLPFERWVHVRFWAPEGWGFFTRNPQEEAVLLFLKSGGRWVSASIGPGGMPANAFGLNRAARGQSAEAALLESSIPKEAFHLCQYQPSVCLERSSIVETVDNPTPLATLCGEIGIVKQKPIPWAWSRSRNLIVMPSRLVRIKVGCQ